MSEHRIRLYLRLHLAEGVGAITFGRFLDAFGCIEEFWAASPSQWLRVEGVGAKLVEAVKAVTDEDAEAELAEARLRGAAVVTSEDEDYPAALRTIYDYPRVLYVWGNLEPTDAVAMAVVGARRCTHYGLEQAERFGQLLGRAGFTVVSGGARGIDTAAHRGCLAVGGRTIAVMGCGLCSTYPPENAELFEQIASGSRGAVLSELPMRTAVQGRNFPKRNRIISGLSLGALIVEAARRSGSLITARVAEEQGRAVFAIPGRVDSPLSQGVNELIRDGVTLVQNLDDILEQLGPVGSAMTVEEPASSDLPLPDGLDPTEKALAEALRGGQQSLDELVRATEIPSGKAASAVTMLVLRGIVEQQPGNVFVLKRRGAD